MVARLGKLSCLFIPRAMCISTLYIMPIKHNLALEFRGESCFSEVVNVHFDHLEFATMAGTTLEERNITEMFLVTAL